MLVVLLVGMSSCHRDHVLSEGKTEEIVKVNETFTVILPEDHTKGYTWFLEDSYDHSLCNHIGSVWHGNAKGVYFEFKALKPGTIQLKFLSRMYTDTLDIKVFKVKIPRS